MQMDKSERTASFASAQSAQDLRNHALRALDPSARVRQFIKAEVHRWILTNVIDDDDQPFQPIELFLLRRSSRRVPFLCGLRVRVLDISRLAWFVKLPEDDVDVVRLMEGGRRDIVLLSLDGRFPLHVAHVLGGRAVGSTPPISMADAIGSGWSRVLAVLTPLLTRGASSFVFEAISRPDRVAFEVEQGWDEGKRGVPESEAGSGAPWPGKSEWIASEEEEEKGKRRKEVWGLRVLGWCRNCHVRLGRGACRVEGSEEVDSVVGLKEEEELGSVEGGLEDNSHKDERKFFGGGGRLGNSHKDERMFFGDAGLGISHKDERKFFGGGGRLGKSHKDERMFFGDSGLGKSHNVRGVRHRSTEGEEGVFLPGANVRREDIVDRRVMESGVGEVLFVVDGDGICALPTVFEDRSAGVWCARNQAAPVLHALPTGGGGFTMPVRESSSKGGSAAKSGRDGGSSGGPSGRRPRARSRWSGSEGIVVPGKGDGLASVLAAQARRNIADSAGQTAPKRIVGPWTPTILTPCPEGANTGNSIWPADALAGGSADTALRPIQWPGSGARVLREAARNLAVDQLRDTPDLPSDLRQWPVLRFSRLRVDKEGAKEAANFFDTSSGLASEEDSSPPHRRFTRGLGRYALEWRYPLSPIQAFAIAITRILSSDSSN